MQVLWETLSVLNQFLRNKEQFLTQISLYPAMLATQYYCWHYNSPLWPDSWAQCCPGGAWKSPESIYYIFTISKKEMMWEQGRIPPWNISDCEIFIILPSVFEGGREGREAKSLVRFQRQQKLILFHNTYSLEFDIRKCNRTNVFEHLISTVQEKTFIKLLIIHAFKLRPFSQLIHWF